MKRRKFISTSIAGGTLLGMGGLAWLSIDANESALTIDTLIRKLDSLDANRIETLGEWNLSQILVHCAESIEFSMSDFPEHKSDLFKSTLGKLAFSAFESKGKMTHGLDEIIPGAPLYSGPENIEYALGRLRKSLVEFDQFDGTLAEHFAYGRLSKSEYEKAHVMHFNNHLLEISTIT